MNVMNYKGHTAQIAFDAADALFIGHLAGIGDVVGFHADTITGLEAAFQQAVDDYVATCAVIGKESGRADIKRR